jgi:hypothetical protein
MTIKEIAELKTTLENKANDEDIIYVSESFFAEKISDDCTYLHLFDNVYDLIKYNGTYQDFPTFQSFIDEICEFVIWVDETTLLVHIS